MEKVKEEALGGFEAHISHVYFTRKVVGPGAGCRLPAAGCRLALPLNCDL
jgi:hypothetical protein